MIDAGLTWDDIAEDYDVEYYDENVLPILIFSDVITQWRTGQAGIIGLDYNVLPFIFDVHGVDAEFKSQTFQDIKVMESAVLDYIRSKVKK